MIICASKPTYGQFKTQIVIPQLSRQPSGSLPLPPKGSLRGKGDFYLFSDPEGRGIKPL